MTDDKRIDRALNRLRMPDGFEQRLSARIDAVATSVNRRRQRRKILRWAGISTAAAAVAAIILLNPGNNPSQQPQELTPEQIQYYTTLAFNEVNYALNKGRESIEMAGTTLENINKKTKNKPCAN
ncbi:MAG: hypothetical protein K2M97_00400 [Muribaculaceae bacterium]|nr:hypothetical protein [Muribaculaceae bacterium]